MSLHCDSMDARPRMLFVYGDSLFAAKWSRHFRRTGWDVHLAASGDEACRLVERLDVTVVMVDGELIGENSAAVCRRILSKRPGQPVVLVAEEAGDAGLGQLRDSVRISQRHHVAQVMDQLLAVGSR